MRRSWGWRETYESEDDDGGSQVMRIRGKYGKW